MKSNSFLSKILYGGGLFFDVAKWLVIFVIVLILINTFWYSIFVVDGISMEPNFKSGELALMDKTFFRGDTNPNRGDAVVVQYPGDPEQHRYIKRVVGLPGENLKITNSIVYINGKKLNERYIPVGTITDPDGNWQLNSEQYFLMGDNRPNSNDSRVFGPVEKRFFIGKTIAILFPSFQTVEERKY